MAVHKSKDGRPPVPEGLRARFIKIGGKRVQVVEESYTDEDAVAECPEELGGTLGDFTLGTVIGASADGMFCRQLQKFDPKLGEARRKFRKLDSAPDLSLVLPTGRAAARAQFADDGEEPEASSRKRSTERWTLALPGRETPAMLMADLTCTQVGPGMSMVIVEGLGDTAVQVGELIAGRPVDDDTGKCIYAKVLSVADAGEGKLAMMLKDVPRE